MVAQAEFSIRLGDRLEARAQVPARPMINAGSFVVGSRGRTGVALASPATTPETATVYLGTVNSGGNIIDFETITLEPGQQLSRFLDELMDTQGATSAEFRSSVPIAILPLQQDGFVLTTQDLFPGRDLPSLFDGN